MRLEMHEQSLRVVGQAGSIIIARQDEAAWKLLMLLMGECEDGTRERTARLFGFSKQRYYQLREAFATHGTAALISRKRGPKSNYRRKPEVCRQIIRYRFLDPLASVPVIGQRLRQNHLRISDRSVFRVIEQYGLQKKKGSTCARPGTTTPRLHRP